MDAGKLADLISAAVNEVLSGKSARLVGKDLVNSHDTGISADAARMRINRQLKKTRAVLTHPVDTSIASPVAEKPKNASAKNEVKPFEASAWNFATGKMMGIEEYFIKYNLPFNDVISYKLVTHTGTPFYNTLFKDTIGPDVSIDYAVVKRLLDKQIAYNYEPKTAIYNLINKEAVLKWADLHFGAHIRNLLLTHDYDSAILSDGLQASVAAVNAYGFKKVHVHILGDLIESLSGLNHINSWHSMDKNETGANAIMFCCEMIAKALRNVVNLGTVKIIGGNHDRLSKDNDEDVKGGCAELIAWGLRQIGFDVAFHPYILTHQVEGINHINLHGDKGISKHKTSDILWKYGKQGSFNFVFEAHLHSIIEKLSIATRDKFKTITDDGIDHRRMHLPSFFTGNYYSETLGYNSNAGYVIVYDNGKGRPNIFTGSI